MAEPDVVLDPDGDLLVILRNPSNIPDIYVKHQPQSWESESESEVSIADSWGLEATKANGEEDAQSTHSTHSDMSVPPSEVEFLVSSKHLSLASSHVRRMLNGPWLEATEIHADGLRHWVVEGFDTDAMTIVLSIMHNRHDKVPQTVRLDMLVEIARIVDYVGCYDVMVLYAKTHWISALLNDFPNSYNVELMLWTCIAGVFREGVIFRECTRLAILGCHSGIPTLGLPILPEISDEIDRLRVHYLDEIFQLVYRMLDELTTKNLCTPQCDATCLGVLARYMHDNSLSPQPTSPYFRLSVDWAIRKINDLPSPGFYMTSKEMIRITNSWSAPFWLNSNTRWDDWWLNDGLSVDIPSIFETNCPDNYFKIWLELHTEWKVCRCPRTEDDKEEEVLPYLHCGFSRLIATVHMLVSRIEGLDIESLKKG
ncbi:hypothetical protein F4860DRAFT_164271 [Xylaria cubensis]|nr:hypothetical protein F4860DRAFT_164271 [Xylaria cubensis]